MRDSEHILEKILARADVRLNGSRAWDIRVLDRRLYGRVLRDKSLGLGESYMEGWWECERLDALFHRLCAAGLDGSASRGPVARVMDAVLERLCNRQSRRRARKVVEKHYDLGNDMFLPWLDPHNQYSCAYFLGTDDLDKAQEQKLDLICRKLCLSPQDTVLDIGCGWGGFSVFAAKNYGCTVRGVNISRNQIAYARKTCAALGLPVDIAHCDYREIRGRFDRVVSIGMFEHVGHKNHRTFMRSVHRSLRATGIFLLHTIGANVSTTGCDAWIRKYIFPNGELPSLAQIARATENLFVIEDVHNLGPHYDKTLVAWNERFQAAWPGSGRRPPETFKRMWEYYLLASAGAFRARALQLWQIVMTPQGAAQPACRVS